MNMAGMMDKINSIKIPVGIEVILYTDDLSGTTQTYRGPYESTQITDINTASSMKVQEYTVHLNAKLIKTNSFNDD